jgi:membrane protein implicated in regulation of membrane protease activity
MQGVFVICALVGGTVLLFQFVLTLIGLGGEALDVDVPEDLDVDLDFDGDVDADATVHHASSSFFGVLSFRTVVAALTFFGLGGLAAGSTGASTPWVLVVAVAAGVAAMYLVYWLMRSLHRLTTEGTARIERAVGRHATVYLRIPGHESGTGKIQIDLQNRTMEYLAMTSGDELPTGAKVVVVDVITPTTVEVQPVLEPERIENA